MIKVTVQYNDHLVDIHFPCSEMTLYAALMEIHAADDNPPELFIHDVVFPEKLDCIKDRFVDLDELNYLAKRMESFFGSEEEQFYEAMKQEGFTELKDIINLTFNLNKYCLIQNIGNMGNVGREYILNRDGCVPANDEDNPQYAEIGRKLMQSGTGIVTEHGILFVDEDIPFEEPYDGQVFPPYIYDAMKKFISMMIVAVLLVSSLSVSAFAADIKVEGGTSQDVYAKYVAGRDIDGYKVKIDWGEMKFAYSSANSTWNTTDHKWDQTGGGWSVNSENGNKITITNHSNKDIKAGLAFAATKDGVGVGTFTHNNKTVTEVTVGNALSGTAQTETVTFMPTGTLGSDMATEGKIGSITITLS